MMKMTVPESFRPPHLLQGHRESQQWREGEENDSARPEGLLDFYIVGSQRKTVRALPVVIPDREC
jgi:hypothetical protein